jgi:hypothetical protein
MGGSRSSLEPRRRSPGLATTRTRFVMLDRFMRRTCERLSGPRYTYWLRVKMGSVRPSTDIMAQAVLMSRRTGAGYSSMNSSRPWVAV